MTKVFAYEEIYRLYTLDQDVEKIGCVNLTDLPTDLVVEYLQTLEKVIELSNKIKVMKHGD